MNAIQRSGRVNIRTLVILFCLSAIVTASKAQELSGYKIKTIVLDAGHGGHDTGCQGAFSNEKDVTLEVTLKVGELITKTFPGVKVIYTRKTDEFIELYERADIANRNRADLFISIHCNANKSHTPYGTETWLMGLHKSESNLEVSMRENSVIKMEDNYQVHYDGFDPNSPEGYIVLSMNQNAHLDQSIRLASLVEEQFRNEGRVSRGVKQAGFLVLWRTTMPSILIETGFLTNREEEKYLNSENGQKILAQNILNAVTAYKRAIEGGGEMEEMVVDEKLVPDSAKVAEVTPVSPATGEVSAVSTSDIVYHVQIYASPKLVNKKDLNLTSVPDELIIDKNEKGMYRYMIGSYLKLEEANRNLQQFRTRGYKDAFVVAYQNGKRIAINNTP